MVLLGQAELRHRKKINFSEEQFRFFSAAPCWEPRQRWWQEHTHLLGTYRFWLSPRGGTEQGVPRSKSCMGGAGGFFPSHG